MKYIVFDVQVSDNLVKEMPFIFPDELVHSHVCKSITHMLGMEHKWSCKPIAAGFCDMIGDAVSCHGESETLGLKSRIAEDDNLVRMCDYGQGIKT